MVRRNTQRVALGCESLESRQVLSAAPTAELQYALELINLTRTNPAAAADRLTANLSDSTKDTLSFYGVDVEAAKREIAAADPRQPLAWSDQLAAAAQNLSQDMATNGFQSHTGSDGSSPTDRIANTGYDAQRIGENAFAYGDSIDQVIQAFVLDWGVADKGHRRTILEPDNGGDDSFKEVGMGVVQSRRLGFGKVVTQNFGVRRGAPAALLGVAYQDRDQNNFYSMGEGQGGVNIEVKDSDGNTQTASTAEAGGYQVELRPGNYQVRALAGGREVLNRNVRVGTKNVKLDVLLSDAPAKPTPTPTPTRPTRTAPTTANPRVTVPNVRNNTPLYNIPNPISTPTRLSQPTLTVQPQDAPVVEAPVTVLSNLTAPMPDATPAPVTVTLSNVGGGFSWNTWKTIPGAK